LGVQFDIAHEVEKDKQIAELLEENIKLKKIEI